MKKSIIPRFAILLTFINLGSLFSQEISKVGEIYSFEVGDVFHTHAEYGYYPGPPEVITKTVDSVLEKTYSLNADTIYYTIQRQFAEISSSNPVWTFSDTIVIESFWDLNSSVNNGNIDTVYNDPDWYNGRTINKVEYAIGDAVHTKKFVAGCGLASDYTFYDDGSFMSESSIGLVYYKKGDEEWGEPLILTGISKISMEKKSIKVSPNPFGNFCFVDLKDYPHLIKSIKIYDLSGNLIKSENVIDKKLIKLETSKFRNGVYVIMLGGKIENISIKIIKQ